MAQFLNITGSRENNDPTFRYKMPKMVARTEGRGNGIRTLVVNMKEISEALNRPPDLATKFFGIELGAQSRWESELEKSTVNGAHATPDLQKMLNSFIDRFVLCPKCHLPETALTVNVKKSLIYHKCSACGAKELVDMSHKLTAYMLKQAELTIKMAALDAAAADLAAAKKKGAAAPAGGAKAAGGDKPGKKGKGGGGGGGGGDEEDEDDAAARAAVAPPAPPPAAAPAAPAPPAPALLAACDALLAAGKDEAGRAAGAAAVAAAAKAGGAPPRAVLIALVAATGAPGAPDAERPRLKWVPLALEALYDADVVTEDDLTAWAAACADAAVKTKAMPFLEWLANAEDEEEEEEEEEEDGGK